MLNQFPQQNPDTPARSIDGEALVITPHDSHLHTLNATATAIWDLADGARSLEEIVDVVVERFEVSRDVAVADARAFVEEATSRGLLLLHERPV